jgi:ParB family chromosome partitioning protein
MSHRKSTNSVGFTTKKHPSAEQIPLKTDSPEIADLTSKISNAGGRVIGAYHEPFSGHPLLVATIPINKVEPTPFQRDLSPAHTKKLADMIQETDYYMDPIVTVPGIDGTTFWSPNGGHRLAAAKMLQLQQITSIISPDKELAFRILALNTEKAHNLKDRCLEVVRMARELVREKPDIAETAFAQIFEAPELITLGILYERNKRFSGGAFRPLLKKVDTFHSESLKESMNKREVYADQIEHIDTEIKRIVEELEQRGFKSPYLRNFVVAKINPLYTGRFRKKAESFNNLSITEALNKMLEQSKKFDSSKVKHSDIALTSAIIGSEQE